MDFYDLFFSHFKPTEDDDSLIYGHMIRKK